MTGHIVILGVFVADTAYRASRQPQMGETLLGQSFALGPGGKGSNQAVAAARAGGSVTFLTRLGDDAFATLAEDTWRDAGVEAIAPRDGSSYTGAAYIFVEESTGNNAIIIAPGAAARISADDIDANRDTVAAARVFVTQLEQPLDAAVRALEIARSGGALTILNPAPAQALDETVLSLCDLVTPNETEAEILTGIRVTDIGTADKAAEKLLAMGCGGVIITLGSQGAYFRDKTRHRHVPAMAAGPVLETTGAGDAFNGGLAAALAEGRDVGDAMAIATATASISVTRAGTAPSMPSRAEIDALLAALG